MDVKALIPLIVQGSMILIVASAGMKSKWSDVECAFRRPRLLLRGVVAVNLVVPLAAILAVLVLPIAPAVKLGIVIMAVSPLAPLAPGKMLKAGAEASIAVGVYALLILLAVLIVPATVALLSAIFPTDVSIPVPVIFWFVLTSILLPLAAGMIIANFAPSLAPTLAAVASGIGNVLLVLLLVVVLYAAGGAMLALIGDFTLIAIVLIVVAGLAAGHLLGGPEPANRMALAAAAATRHPGIAGIIAHRHSDNPKVMLAVMLFLLVSVIVSGVYQLWAKRRLADENVVRPHPWARKPAPRPGG